MDPLTFADVDAEAELPQSRLDADESDDDGAVADEPQSRGAVGPRWRPVRVRTDQVSVDGGYSSAPQIVDSISITDHQGHVETFFKIVKRSSWFNKMIAGKEVRNGQLRCVDVLDELRDKIDHKLGLRGFGAPDAAVAEDEQPAVADMEPIDLMDALEELTPKKVNKPMPQRPKRLRGSIAKSQIMVVPMRRVPLCVDANCTQIHQVRTYLAGATKRELWISVESLPWLVQYAADQVRLQGVVGSTAVADWESELVDMVPNCSRVPNLRLDWNFSTKQWDGKFVRGPCKGIVQSMSPAAHTNQGWANLRDNELVPHIALVDASRSIKRDGAKKLLMEWCAAIAGGHRQEFEATWNLQSAVAGGHRQEFEATWDLQSAVAAEESAAAAARSVAAP